MVVDFTREKPLAIVFGLEDRDAYLTRSLPPYPMYHYLNTNLPPNSKIYLIYMNNLTFLCERECYADSMFEYYTLKKILASSSSPDDVYQKLKGMGFTHLVYNAPYVTGEKSMLSLEEKTLFRVISEKIPNSGQKRPLLLPLPNGRFSLIIRKYSLLFCLYDILSS